jgi:hypothetical protein
VRHGGGDHATTPHDPSTHNTHYHVNAWCGCKCFLLLLLPHPISIIPLMFWAMRVNATRRLPATLPRPRKTYRGPRRTYRGPRKLFRRPRKLFGVCRHPLEKFLAAAEGVLKNILGRRRSDTTPPPERVTSMSCPTSFRGGGGVVKRSRILALLLWLLWRLLWQC